MVQGKYPVGEFKKRGTLENHPDIIGITGSEELACKTEEVAGMYDSNPRLELLQGVRQPITKGSALFFDHNIYGSLGISGQICVGGMLWGFALGIQKELSDKVDEEKTK